MKKTALGFKEWKVQQSKCCGSSRCTIRPGLNPYALPIGRFRVQGLGFRV